MLDPRSCWNCGSQPFIVCINDIENYNSNKLEFRFDASGKGAYDRWGAMVDVVGRWMRAGAGAGGQGGWKMEADDGGWRANGASR